MTQSTPLIAPTNIVFDLGGVMAEISHTWEEAARCAGVACMNLGDGSTRLNAFPGFDQYQAATQRKRSLSTMASSWKSIRASPNW